MTLRSLRGVALLVPALALTACTSSGKTTSASATTASATTSASATPTGPTTPSAAPISTSSVHASPSAAATTSASRSAPPAGLARCPSSVLVASRGRSEGAAGHVYVAILFTNRGRATCELTGYPGVSFIGAGDAYQVGAPAEEDSRFPRTQVRLNHGTTVSATIELPSDYRLYPTATCRPATSTGLRIYPPGSTGWLRLSMPGTVCTNPALHYLRVTVIRAATSPG